LGKTGEILFTPEDRQAGKPAEEMATALAAGSASDERWHLRKDGQRIRVSGEMTPIYDKDGKHLGFTKIVRDITEQHIAQERLRVAQTQLADRADKLEQAVARRTMELAERNRQLEAFVYSIAHDLRAPLRAMQGFASLLVEEFGQTVSDRGRDYANRINLASQYMDRLLVDLLNFSRISLQTIELGPVDLHAVVRSTLDQLQPQIQERQARIETPGPWPLLFAHDLTLGQVLLNLISNAIKFVPAGTTPVVVLRTEPRGEFVRVWVEDNGIGIAAEHQPQLFRLFGRLRGGDYAGTGIGLAIVKEGVARMGGQAGVESAPNQGSRFWFDLRPAAAGASVKDSADE
jgi:signal transduction histidine kinase